MGLAADARSAGAGEESVVRVGGSLGPLGVRKALRVKRAAAWLPSFLFLSHYLLSYYLLSCSPIHWSARAITIP